MEDAIDGRPIAGHGHIQLYTRFIPVFLDGIGEVGGRVDGAVEVVEGRIALNVGGEVLARVGAHARFRVPPVVARAPRENCSSREIRVSNQLVY